MSIEYVINRILDLDPNLQELLNPLQGKIIHIICLDMPKFNVFLSIDYKYLRITAQPAGEVVTTVSAPIVGFLSLVIQKQQADIRANQIKITGDLHVAEQLQNFFFQLDLDWEEALSTYTGDVFAHQAIYTLKQLRSLQKETHTSLEQMLIEYLQEESGILPTKCEIENFMHDVDQIRMDVDRIEARIKAYESN